MGRGVRGCKGGGKVLIRLYYIHCTVQFLLRSLVVRTLGFHPKDRGSNPRGERPGCRGKGVSNWYYGAGDDLHTPGRPGLWEDGQNWWATCRSMSRPES